MVLKLVGWVMSMWCRCKWYKGAAGFRCDSRRLRNPCVNHLDRPACELDASQFYRRGSLIYRCIRDSSSESKPPTAHSDILMKYCRWRHGTCNWPILLCKVKRQYLLTWKVSRYCLLALHYRILVCRTEQWLLSGHRRSLHGQITIYSTCRYYPIDHRSGS